MPRYRVIGAIVITVSLLFSTAITRAAAASGGTATGTSAGAVTILRNPEVTPAIRHDVSPPLRSIGSNGAHSDVPRDRPLRLIPTHGSNSGGPDGALQTSAGAAASTSAVSTFPGVGNGDYGFSPNAAPPDTNGAVGATQYVQWVNESFAVFDKSSHALLKGPIAGNSLWQGFGGGCEANNDGDPIVQYDKAANRWIMTQFSISNSALYDYLQCVAVSTTSDATGTYNRYAFDYGTTQMPDYPKLGVWPDGYYISYNIFNNGSSFAGAKTCVFDRNAMLAGTAATQQCFQLSTSYGGLLPSDLDGSNPPPSGSPNFFLNFGTNSLNLWKFHADWANTANTTLTGPINIPVASFSEACNGGTCIPQQGVRQQLDSLADRLMYRLAYRHFADGHESLVVNHSISTSVAGASTVGLRWYELQNSTGGTMASGTPVVYQQGTYAPDATYRWMGSIAMDGSGDMALGYSKSSSSIYPSIAYTGRVPGDALGTMEAETSIVAGGGSQTYIGGLSRWGDYSSMSVDPVDDCTFWYTTEYLKSTGGFNWSTEIGSFKFPGCGSSTTTTTTTVPATTTTTTTTTAPATTTTTTATTTTTTTTATTTTTTTTVPPPPTADFSISASPSSVSVPRGQTASYTVAITPNNGFTSAVTFSLSGAPAGSTATFNPPLVTGSGNSTLTIATAPKTSPGDYSLTITGTSGSLTHSTTANLHVSPH